MSLWDSVGQTPLLKIPSLSRLTGCEIYGKAEFMNPGGSIKDRTAKGIIRKLEKAGKIQKGSVLVEGTAGNTGIGLATLAPERGYRVLLSMPNNQAAEKYELLKAVGAEIRAVDPCPFKNPNHFYHQAKSLAEKMENAVWTDQFENLANFKIHYEETGPEIIEDLDGMLDFFVCATGTGGSFAGISKAIKEAIPEAQCWISDPMGSGVESFFRTRNFESEGGSITEGIGIMRLTENLKQAFDAKSVDGVFSVNDQQMISMLFHVAREDGIFVGTSAALNLFAAYSIGKKFQDSGKRIVTLLCDPGTRYQSKLLNDEWLKEKGLKPGALTQEALADLDQLT